MLSLVNVNSAGQPIESEYTARIIQDENFENYLKHLYHVKLARQRGKRKGQPS